MINPFDELRMKPQDMGAGSFGDRYGDIDSKGIRAQERERYKQDTRYRKYLALWVMVIVPIWLVTILLIVCMCASKVWNLSDVQMSTLLATTTVNVLGLAYIVLKGLFQNRNE